MLPYWRFHGLAFGPGDSKPSLPCTFRSWARKIAEKFAELRVRSQVIKEMANIYIGRHIQDLGRRSHVLKLRASPAAGTLQDQFRAHIESRVDEYPEDTFGQEHGAVPETIRDLAKKQMCETGISNTKRAHMDT